MSRLSGKRAIVSGGSDGIGQAIAKRLSDEGAYVIITGRDEAKLKSACGANMEIRVQDASNATGYAAMVEDVAKDGLDILINNAAFVAQGMMDDAGEDVMRQSLATNVEGPYAAMRAAMKAMADKGGAIVNISSINGDRAMPGAAPYSASKAALTHLSRVAAMEGARQNIRINTVTPGPIMTPGTQAWADADPDYVAKIADANPMGRFGKPEEVAATVAFLCSDDAAYITGANIPVDGGKGNELHVPGRD